MTTEGSPTMTTPEPLTALRDIIIHEALNDSPDDTVYDLADRVLSRYDALRTPAEPGLREALPCGYRKTSGRKCGGGPDWWQHHRGADCHDYQPDERRSGTDRRATPATIDAERLARRIHETLTADDLLPDCSGTHAMGYATCIRLAARLREDRS